MLATSLALALPLAPFGQTWLVDGDPGCPNADFATIQAAVDAAADGDTIFVAPLPAGEAYAGFTVLTKGVRIVGVGDGFASVRVDGTIELIGSSQDQEIVLQGVTVRGDGLAPSAALQPRLSVVACGGPVWVEQCRLDGRDTEAFGGSSPFPSVNVEASLAVTLIGSELHGFTGGDPLPPLLVYEGPGSPALQLSDAGVSIYESLLFGGDAGPGGTLVGPPTSGFQGSPAVRLTNDSDLFAAGSGFFAGDGGAGCFGQTGAGIGQGGTGPGGDPFVVVSQLAEAELLDVTLIGGGGSTPGASTPTGAGASNVDLVAGSVRSLAALEPVVAEGSAVDLSFRGEPGDTVFLAFQFEQEHGSLPAFVGQKLLALPAPILPLGIAALDGTLTASIPVPAGLLAPGTALGVGVQAGVVSTTGGAFLSSGAWVELVDAVSGTGLCP